MWMMDNAKSNVSILWINLWQNECQQSVNNCWLCILDNLGGNRLQIVIKEVLGAFIGNRESETLPAPSWKWASMKCQESLAFHYGQSQCNVPVIVYIHGFGCFGTLNGARILSGSSLNEMSCYCPRGCGRNIPHISPHEGCHILVYGCLWSTATHNTEDARHKIVDTPMTLIFKMK